jgi:hypothetical protein
MKTALILVAALAATIGSAAAQGSRTAGANTGGTTQPANGNIHPSSGNSTNTSSSAANSNPNTSAPNYKPAAPAGTGAKTKKPAATGAGTGKGVVVRSGGQGHNSTPSPKGKIQVAPTTPAGNNNSSNIKNNQ